jgi:hypothetical protein
VQTDIVAKGVEMKKSMNFISIGWIILCSLGCGFLLSFGSMFIIANLSNGTAESMAFLSGIIGGIVGLGLGAKLGWKTKD